VAEVRQKPYSSIPFGFSQSAMLILYRAARVSPLTPSEAWRALPLRCAAILV
jgi:hypothetical protein